MKISCTMVRSVQGTPTSECPAHSLDQSKILHDLLEAPHLRKTIRPLTFPPTTPHLSNGGQSYHWLPSRFNMRQKCNRGCGMLPHSTHALHYKSNVAMSSYFPSCSAFFCFMYSSNVGAAEIDLRGSGSSTGSGSLVSAIPPVPTCFGFSSSSPDMRCIVSRHENATGDGCKSYRSLGFATSTLREGSTRYRISWFAHFQCARQAPPCT